MKRVLLLLADGFEIYEASAFIDVIGWNHLEGDRSTRLYTCGHKWDVKSAFDQKMMVDFLIEEIDINDFEALAIPGGFEEYGFYKDAYSDAFSNIIRKFNEQNKPIASMRQQALAGFGVDVIHETVVIDGNIITSYNPSTAIDVAFTLLEKLTNSENANYLRGLMGFKDTLQNDK